MIGVLFVLPPNTRAGWAFAGAVLLLAGYWWGHMRARFRGPQIPASLGVEARRWPG